MNALALRSLRHRPRAESAGEQGRMRWWRVGIALLLIGYGIAMAVITITVAALTTVVPFAIARDEGVVPDGGLWLAPVVVAAVVALTLGSARGAVRSAVQGAARSAVR